MNYQVILSLEAVEDVLRIALSHQPSATIIEASRQCQAALINAPRETGMHLREGLYYIDRKPLRAFFTIDDDQAIVEVVGVRHL